MAHSPYRNRHGIFISYKRSHRHLAGRIFDYLRSRGFDPFMDEHSMAQNEDFRAEIEAEIRSAPYFLCLLTPDGLDDLLSPDYRKHYFSWELLIALSDSQSPKTRVIVVGDKDDMYRKMKELPAELASLQYINSEELPKGNQMFYSFMDRFCKTGISPDDLQGVLNWREYTALNSNSLILSRAELEGKHATLDNRFGEDFMQCVREKQEYSGISHVREVNMACYAANLLFTPKRTMIDRQAYDYGMMFNVFTELLNDKDFSMRLITTAPGSAAVKDAIQFDRLGNSALEECEEACFLGSYAKLHELMKREPYAKAVAEHRFIFRVTECALPYALFHVVYNNGWEEFNHIKVDLYALGIDSSVNRRSMVFFEQNDADKENYAFFVSQFRYLWKQSQKRSETLIRKNHAAWMEKWDKVRPDFD